ncbi:isoprene synthase, chloroplastic-like [Arachis duranensis]|uniref:Isoprene synthase, chloroplastic n=1 Tax=Arachis duranensis TaxID=130453 RepID=A0A9C6TDD4_ARADU|nr:isoprene synthase, chloroplastic [Arachis duranensis]XP_052112282.1 isoprene synthase, chloroplastic-like [Arachis duranensis]
MASELISLPYALSTTQRVVVVVKHRNHFGRKTVTHATAKIHFICGSTKKDDGQLIGRRSANYQPNLWTYEFLHHQSHHNHHVVERIEERAKKLEEKVRYIMMNSSDMEPLSLLEFIDDLHRLGLSYKFPNHINSALSRIHSSQHMLHHTQKTLHATALLFRILRQHSFHVSQGV